MRERSFGWSSSGPVVRPRLGACKSFQVGRSVPFWVLVALIAVIFVVSSDPPIALFTLFCGYALSGYVYWAWRWFRGESNPAKPVPAVPAEAPKSP